MQQKFMTFCLQPSIKRNNHRKFAGDYEQENTINTKTKEILALQNSSNKYHTGEMGSTPFLHFLLILPAFFIKFEVQRKFLD